MIFQTSQFFKPVFVLLGDSKYQDSSVKNEITMRIINKSK